MWLMRSQAKSCKVNDKEFCFVCFYVFWEQAQVSALPLSNSTLKISLSTKWHSDLFSECSFVFTLTRSTSAREQFQRLVVCRPSWTITMCQHRPCASLFVLQSLVWETVHFLISFQCVIVVSEVPLWAAGCEVAKSACCSYKGPKSDSQMTQQMSHNCL